MESKNITFAKIVATPTPTSWAQAYNAGGLFAVLSLTKEAEDSLSVLGKDLLNTFEEEYFTLETKNLDSIKQAILTTCKKIPQDVSTSFIVASFIKNILYAFVFNKGKIIIKRLEKTGQILGETAPDSIGTENQELASSSGFLEDGDIVIIETNQFSKLIPKNELIESLDHFSPSEIAENLSPKIYGTAEGGAAAIIVLYKSTVAIEEIKNEETEKEILEPVKKQINLAFLISPLFKIKEKINSSNNLSFSHSKKLLLSLAFIIILVFVASIFFASKKQNEAKTKALFNEIYPPAQKKYDEGKSLIGLNKNLARDSLLEAEKILNNGKIKFDKKSSEEKQILDLLKKTEEDLIAASDVNTAQVQQVDQNKSLLLLSEIKNSNSQYFAIDEKNVYFATDKGIFIEGKESVKIKNEGYWSGIAGLGVYLGNIYILDKKSNQIIKFSNAEASVKTNYFISGVSVDLSRAKSIAIDGSIWILMQDGTMLKFTRGKADNFKVSSLDKTFSNPSRVFTKNSFDKIYILDNGNSRIVVLNKDGSYQSQYQSKILKDAQDFEVLEKDKKIYILAKNKVWEIDIK